MQLQVEDRLRKSARRAARWARTLGSSEPIWGDGFADDDWSAVMRVAGWDEIGPDQYLRFYPRLACGTSLPAPLLAHLADGVAARAWRLRVIHGVAGVVPLRSISRDHVDAVGPGRHAEMFPTPRRAAAIRRGRGANSADAAQEHAGLRFLDDMLWRVRRHDVGAAEPDRTALFAYLSGIHPAYVWPGAIASHERDAAAGWLGVVARGRPALMPAEVADYFLDVIACDGGRVVIRDPQLAPIAQACVDPLELRVIAAARREGEVRVMRARAGADPRQAGPTVVPPAQGARPSADVCRVSQS